MLQGGLFFSRPQGCHAVQVDVVMKDQGYKKITEYRRYLDGLLKQNPKALVSEKWTWYEFGLVAPKCIEPRLLAWLAERDFTVKGLSSDPKSIWMGWETMDKKQRLTVHFHPEVRAEAILFKLTWG
jgi:hypothetical protein